MKLYYMPGACSLASHILLAETGATYELERVGRDKKTEHFADFLSINPKGYVPALKLDDGEIITEGVSIQSFIADSRPGSHLLPKPGTRERLRADELMIFIATEIHKGFSPLFSPTLPEAVKQGYRDKLVQRCALIDKQLGDDRTWLTGETFTIADGYLFMVTSWAKMLKVDLSRFAHVQAWLARVAARPPVRAALKAEGLA